MKLFKELGENWGKVLAIISFVVFAICFIGFLQRRVPVEVDEIRNKWQDEMNKLDALNTSNFQKEDSLAIVKDNITDIENPSPSQTQWGMHLPPKIKKKNEPVNPNPVSVKRFLRSPVIAEVKADKGSNTIVWVYQTLPIKPEEANTPAEINTIQILRKEGDEKVFSVIAELSGNDNTSYTDNKITPNTNYSYKISIFSDNCDLIYVMDDPIANPGNTVESFPMDCVSASDTEIIFVGITGTVDDVRMKGNFTVIKYKPNNIKISANFSILKGEMIGGFKPDYKNLQPDGKPNMVDFTTEYTLEKVIQIKNEAGEFTLKAVIADKNGNTVILDVNNIDPPKKIKKSNKQENGDDNSSSLNEKKKEKKKKKKKKSNPFNFK